MVFHLCDMYPFVIVGIHGDINMNLYLICVIAERDDCSCSFIVHCNCSKLFTVYIRRRLGLLRVPTYKKLSNKLCNCHASLKIRASNIMIVNRLFSIIYNSSNFIPNIFFFNVQCLI